MAQDDKSPTILSEHHAKLNRDIVVLESIVQLALESLQDFATLLSRLNTATHYAARGDVSDEDRRWVMGVVHLLGEECELDAQRRHETLRLSASRYWLTTYGGNARSPVWR